MGLKQKLEDNGIAAIQAVLSKETIREALSISSLREASHGGNILEIYKPVIRGSYDPSIQKLEKSLREELRPIIERMRHVGDGTSLERIDAYTSKVSELPVLPWHTDRAFSGDKIIHNRVQNKLFSYKVFIYLSDCSKENGSLAVLPGSHLITSGLRRLMRKGLLEYEPFWALTDFLSIIKRPDIKKMMVSENNFVTEETLEEFVSQGSSLAEGQCDGDFDISGNAGDAVIFDERTFHRGGKCTSSERTVVRLFMLNGAGSYKAEPITDVGERLRDSLLGEFNTGNKSLRK